MVVVAVVVVLSIGHVNLIFFYFSKKTTTSFGGWDWGEELGVWFSGNLCKGTFYLYSSIEMIHRSYYKGYCQSV